MKTATATKVRPAAEIVDELILMPVLSSGKDPHERSAPDRLLALELHRAAEELDRLDGRITERAREVAERLAHVASTLEEERVRPMTHWADSARDLELDLRARECCEQRLVGLLRLHEKGAEVLAALGWAQ